jgi:hypothetical protein
MGKNKPDGKAKGKSSQLVIRIDKAERTAFVSLCEELDTSAAREIRRFMRAFVASHAQKPPEPAVPAAEAGPDRVAPLGEMPDGKALPVPHDPAAPDETAA